MPMPWYFITGSIVFVLITLALSAFILMQSDRSAGLSGSFGGSDSTDTYYSKNKGRSLEGTLAKWTKILGALFLIVALALNLM